jgi:hypothetical protein
VRAHRQKRDACAITDASSIVVPSLITADRGKIASPTYAFIGSQADARFKTAVRHAAHLRS